MFSCLSTHHEKKHIKSEREEWRNIGREEKLVEMIRKKRAKGKILRQLQQNWKKMLKPVLIFWNSIKLNMPKYFYV